MFLVSSFLAQISIIFFPQEKSESTQINKTNEPLGAPSSLLHNPGEAKTAPKPDATWRANVGGVTVAVSPAKRDTPETNNLGPNFRQKKVKTRKRVLGYKGSLWVERLREKKREDDATAAAAAAAVAAAAQPAATPVVQPAVSVAETAPSAESLLEVLRYLSKRSILQDVCDSKPTAAAVLHTVLEARQSCQPHRGREEINHSPLLQSFTPPLFRRYYFVYLHLFLVVLTTRNIHPSISKKPS